MPVYRKKNHIVEGLSGKLGNTVVFRQVNGRTVLANKGRPRKKVSEKQRRQSDRFKAAGQYASKQMADPVAKAEYAKGIAPHKNAAHRVAVTDYLNAPEVHYIRSRGYSGRAGELITVKATDDFRVTAVEVVIISGDGREQERGPAMRVRLKPDIWRYRTVRKNPHPVGTVIKAIARDRPGNRTEGVWRVGTV